MVDDELLELEELELDEELDELELLLELQEPELPDDPELSEKPEDPELPDDPEDEELLHSGIDVFNTQPFSVHFCQLSHLFTHSCPKHV